MNNLISVWFICCFFVSVSLGDGTYQISDRYLQRHFFTNRNVPQAPNGDDLIHTVTDRGQQKTKVVSIDFTTADFILRRPDPGSRTPQQDQANLDRAINEDRLSNGWRRVNKDQGREIARNLDANTKRNIVRATLLDQAKHDRQELGDRLPGLHTYIKSNEYQVLIRGGVLIGQKWYQPKKGNKILYDVYKSFAPVRQIVVDTQTLANTQPIGAKIYFGARKGLDRQRPDDKYVNHLYGLQEPQGIFK